MAEGLIQPRQDDEEMEDLGSEYFRNLLSRSFFQQSRINKSQFLMHDLIHDLAQTVAGNICFRMEERSGGSKQQNIPIKARHSSYLASGYDVTKRFEVFSKLTSLRTFLPLMPPNSGKCYLAHRVNLELVPTLRCLRVLSFHGYYITKLSDSIGELKHLRYLDLSKTRIRGLPESITTLYNLQTLLLEECTCLEKLPSMFQKLVNLRHLNIEGAYRLEGMPLQIGKLTCLQTLSNLVVGKDNCSGLKELGPLKHLQGTLRISKLENVMEAEDAKDAELIKKTKISALLLEWSSDIDGSKDRTSELEILDGLRPQNDLVKLVLRYYGGTTLPNWLTPASFPHMLYLKIENCYECTSLPPLGQLPSLKTLWISGMASVKSVGSEFCGVSLVAEECPTLESLTSSGELPATLQRLCIHNCPKLESVAKSFHHNSFLTTIRISKCENLQFLNGVETLLLPSNLRLLSISDCEKMQGLQNSIYNLTTLRDLEIGKCLSILSFPKEGFPTNRTRLRIYGLKITDALFESGLDNLTFLKELEIGRYQHLVSFPEMTLPASLTSLNISDLLKLSRFN
ncbi:hypothetical protein I3843_16G091000 [Carya illinoinensis]|nr:hypothetical protein I3843_16G091000 [Carya illinoinensis]